MSDSILLDAATASCTTKDIAGVASDIFMIRRPLIADVSEMIVQYEDGSYNWEYFIPYMICSHYELEFGTGYVPTPKQIASYLNGGEDCIAAFGLYEAQLIHGLADAYYYQDPATNFYNVSMAMCENVYKCLYRSIDRSYMNLQSGYKPIKLLQDIQNTSIQDCLKYCLDGRYLPNMFKAGGLHVGLIIVNFILWQYSSYKIVFLDTGKGILEDMRYALSTNQMSDSDWAFLAENCVVSLDELKDIKITE